ncbi:DUF4367 domain-containing protein [Paenibacillus sp. ACRSA]|uniref:DUF4367 domain-containing protein n=1 Tax=Paenibacillus sp. ACRSA TaxID=2918211 RepID=UPI001EF49E67|nr:DUF4367 domain-containing protein [Paenibacillus sp. ACRSA]MCG7379415.1 DUF4367 domain-containing protein [Paenibacillus sp. ACRSA]
MFKWMMSMIIIVFIISVEMNNSQLTALANPVLAYSNAELDKLKSVADFNIFTPSFSIQNYKLEIKEPYPFNPDQEISKIRLHFFDESGKSYLFGVEEHKAVGYKINRDIITIDVRNHTSTTRTVIENFKFSERGEIININGIEGRFEAWVNHVPGGYLRWIHNDTFIEIDSGELTKDQMIALAKSMNENRIN